MTDSPRFFILGELVVRENRIISIDLSRIEDFRILVSFEADQSEVEAVEVVGIQAIDLLMAIKPSALEGRRLRWVRHMWFIHNVIGHPLMQFLALLKQHNLAMKVHDLTVPRPLGRKGDI